MFVVRWILGRLVLGVNFLTRPTPVVRDKAAQDAMDAATARMALYQFHACPFCVKVRRHMRRHALNIELRDAKTSAEHERALVEQGGKRKVPCLRINNPDGGDTWLYESDDIIAFLNAELELA